MKRWDRNLKKQVAAIEKHTSVMVDRLLYFAKKAKRFEEKLKKDPSEETKLQLEHVYLRMGDIADNLSSVESYVQDKWPHVMGLLQAAKTVKNEKDEANQ